MQQVCSLVRTVHECLMHNCSINTAQNSSDNPPDSSNVISGLSLVCIFFFFLYANCHYYLICYIHARLLLEF